MNKSFPIPFIIRLFTFLVVIGFVLALSPVFVSYAAAETASMTISPVTLALQPGETANLEISVDNVQDLYGIELHLKFDSQVVELVDADPSKDGVQIQAGEWLKAGFAAQNTVDNEQGTLDFAATLLNPAEPLQGTGSLVSLHVKAKGAGASTLTLEGAILANREGEAIPYTWQAGEISVAVQGQKPAVPEADNAGGGRLLAIAVGGLVTLLLAGLILVFVLRSSKTQG